ncbi:MAG: Omp28 family outer membrane lipoprotein [Bacteroidetes bacterium]|nr:Omp28 family outer membrane lipoprotein [Bacteroidota bacterium]
MKHIAWIVLAIALSGCDKIDQPFTETPTGGGGPNPQTYIRKVLIEDFTGAACKNCPDAANTAKNIQKNLYPGKVVVMAIHSGFFAVPGGPFPYDFRTPEGEQLATDFGVQAYPNGMVNRSTFGLATSVVGHGEWASRTDSLLKLPAVATINIANAYNDVTRVISTTITTKALTALTGTFKLATFYLEDSLIKPQLNGSVLDPNYVHMHALRGAFAGTYGETVFNNAAANDSIIKPYSLTIKADAVSKNCIVVAYLYDDTTKEIVQVEEKHFD